MIFPGIPVYALQSRTHILCYVQLRALEAHIETYAFNCPPTYTQAPHVIYYKIFLTNEDLRRCLI